MKKKKHKGNPYRDPKTGQFAAKVPRYRPHPGIQGDVRNVEDDSSPRRRPLLNWGLIGLMALTLLFWAAIGITLKGWLQ